MKIQSFLLLLLTLIVSPLLADEAERAIFKFDDPKIQV